jgi:hypothetical protein
LRVAAWRELFTYELDEQYQDEIRPLSTGDFALGNPCFKE